jgi:hypothetical protein
LEPIVYAERNKDGIWFFVGMGYGMVTWVRE